MYYALADMTNDEDFECVFTLDDENGEAQSLTNIDLEVSFFDSDDCLVMQFGPDSDEITKITDSENGDEYFSIFVPSTRMQAICPGTYKVSARTIEVGRVRQLFVVQLQIKEGGF